MQASLRKPPRRLDSGGPGAVCCGRLTRSRSPSEEVDAVLVGSQEVEPGEHRGGAKLKEAVSERVLGPLRVFASNASIGEDKDSDGTPVRAKQPSKTSTNIKLVKESPAQHI